MNEDETGLLRERKTQKDGEELPVMCSGCHGFFTKKYKSRHQQICPANGSNIMLPMVSIESAKHAEKFSNAFKSLLNTLRLDKVGDCIKSDEIILMIGNRSFNSLKRKKDKKEETSKYVRARMRLTARVLIAFKNVYDNQTEVKIEHKLENAADIFRRETIIILGEAINEVCEKPETVDTEVADSNESLTDQKSGLKISILNLLKHNAKYLIGYFLMKNQDDNSKKVTDFLQVLKLVEDEIFGDALYDINYRRNVKQRKPKTLPNNEDVQKLLDGCIEVMTSINVFNAFSEQFVTVRAATATYLIVFNARRGGEPVRLLISQWEEALKGEWTDHLPDDEENTDLLVTFQTGKGADHLVPVMFPPETHNAWKYLTNLEVRDNVNIPRSNKFTFASTNQSDKHTSGWHCVNEMLVRTNQKGSFNATTNRHRVASLLSKLQLTEKEQEMIFKHFGHSRKMNENVYQAAAGTLQLQTTGKRLLQVT